MSFDELQSGTVIRFPYLWAREADRGETEGRKYRPTAVGFRLRRSNGADTLLLFPITSQPPGENRFAVEIPDTEKHRAGLDGTSRPWIILDEYNEDEIARSYYLEPGAMIGRFSRAFFEPVALAFIRRRQEGRRVSRLD